MMFSNESILHLPFHCLSIRRRVSHETPWPTNRQPNMLEHTNSPDMLMMSDP
jgi:hypothetical protein